MAPKTTCGAHDIMVESVTHLRDSISDLYALNRKASDEIGEVNVRLATVEIKLDTWREESERQQAALSETFKDGISRIESMIKARPYQDRQRWKPAHTVALLTGVLGPGGVAGILSLFKAVGK
jgi:hypothetical protein